MNVGLGFGVRKSGFHVDRRQVFSELRPFWRRLSWQLNIGRSRRKRISHWSLDMGFCLLDYNKLPLRSCRNPHFGKISRKGTCRVSGTAVSENKAWRNAGKKQTKTTLAEVLLNLWGKSGVEGSTELSIIEQTDSGRLMGSQNTKLP